ncbi:ATP-binding cassette domain-containing protein, partial [Clostridium sp.]|uniref:ABC transporter ATP-binding protein n=1 Tax=Clostridium sp. TaxID=1506 RepID=UPI002913FE2A
RNAEVLIFDEPTAVLTPQEIDDLIKIMQNLINEGKSIILITHKLKEIKAAADRCTVIRRGKCIGTVDVKTTTEADMAKMMVGRQVSFKVDKVEANPGDEVLRLENLSVKNNKKVLGLKDFSLNVRKGEIVGVAGVEGNGQTELVEAITGMRGIESGSIFFNGKDISKTSIRKRIDEGIAHIPEDRHKRGLILDYTMEDNMVLKVYKNEPFSKNGLINRSKITEYANNIIETFDVRAGEGGKSMARSLSGGNQQKGIIGREVQVEQRDSGKAVLLVSLELDEILNVSDRIAIVNNGELIGIVNASETDENEVGLMMAGIKRGES